MTDSITPWYNHRMSILGPPRFVVRRDGATVYLIDLEVTSMMYYWKLRRLSKVTLKYFTALEGSNSWPSKLKEKSYRVLLLLRKTASVFSFASYSLWVAIHAANMDITTSTKRLTSCQVAAETTRPTSSAKPMNVQLRGSGNLSCESYTRFHRSGPITDLCGTPMYTHLVLQRLVLQLPHIYQMYCPL